MPRCPRRGSLRLDVDRRAERNGRQGVRYVLQEGMTVMDPATMQEVPADGQTVAVVAVATLRCQGRCLSRGNLARHTVPELFVSQRRASCRARACVPNPRGEVRHGDFTYSRRVHGAFALRRHSLAESSCWSEAWGAYLPRGCRTF